MAQIGNRASRIFVNAFTKDPQQPNSRFTQRFTPALTNCESISLVSVSLPFLAYPFPTHLRELILDDGTGAGFQTYTIPTETYDDGTDFKNVMNAYFTGLGADLQFDYNPNTNKLSLTNSVGAGGVAIGETDGALKLGFSDDQFNQPLTATIVAGNMPRFDATQVIYVELENIGQSGADNFPTNRIISQINVNTTFGGIIQQQTDVEEQAMPTPQYIPELQVRLLGEDLKELELDGNANVCMEFFIKHRNTFESSIGGVPY